MYSYNSRIQMHKGSQQFEDWQSDIDDDFETHQILSMPETNIKDVWAHNFNDQIKKLMKLAQRFNVIAMDTQFPGIIATRCEHDQRYYSEQECEYFLVKRNVEETKMIQIGLSIADEDGNVPYPVCTWQFNFKFDKDKDKIMDQSYELLVKAGVHFDRLTTEGIDYALFAEYIAGSCLVLNKKMKWVVFHGSSDFAYLLKLVLGEDLPPTINDFYKTMKTYFPNIYDLKYIIKDVPELKQVGLAKLSYEIGCSRIGPQHQAGSDSLLTLACYFKMLQKNNLFSSVQFSSCLNIIFGIGLGFIKSSVSSYNYPQSNNYNHCQYDSYSQDYQNAQEYYERGHSHNHGHNHGHNHAHNHAHSLPHNVYMSQMHGYMQNMSNYNNGPLYQYLHHQNQPALYQNYMYGQNQDHTQKRYGGM